MTVRTMAWVEATLSRGDALLIASAAGGGEWAGAVVDSRAECSGRIFFAIRGERTDGHRYVRDAYRAGAAAVVVEDENLAGELADESIPFLHVRSSVEALQELARAYRAQLDARVVAVTGSAGKTTTKEYIRAVMRTKYRVHGNPGNYNSLIGVPVTVLEAGEDCEYLVSEVGANKTGEIDFLARLVRPDVGVITNIGDAHVGHFGSRDAIAAAKGELLDHIDASGTAVLPRDDDYYQTLRARARCRVLTFGTADADYTLSDVRSTGSEVSFTVNGEPLVVRAPGSYHAMNACAAWVVGEVCGVEPGRIAAALADVSPMAGRGRIHRDGGVIVVDESYNASPASMELSLTMLGRIEEASRRIAVLGDMKELGDEAPASHERIGRHAAGAGVDELWWVGEHAADVARGVKGAALRFESFDDVDAAIEAARGRFSPGDAVLIKASRACALDRFVAALLDILSEGKGA